MVKDNKKFNLILALVVLFELVLVMYMNYRFGQANIDADNSSELVLAQFLAKEKAFLSRDWFYSTELRVLNTQVVLSLLFRFFGNFRLVRMAGTGILCVILAASYIFMISKLKLGKIAKASVCMLLLPFCSCYQQFVLFGLYYIPHICIEFVAIGLLMGYLENGKLKNLYLTLMLLLSFVAGLGGIRLLVVLYCPLVVAFILNWYVNHEFDRKWLVSIFTMVAALFGFAVNAKFLSKIYTFKSFSGTEFSSLDFFARTDAIVNGIMEFMGYKAGRRVMGLGAPANFLAIAMLVAFVIILFDLIKHIREYRKENVFVILFFIASFGVNLFTFYFADMWESNGNYLIPFMIFVVPVMAIYFSCMDFKTVKSRALIFIIVCAVLVNSATEYFEWKNTDINTDKAAIIDYLVSSGYERGYADFWDANVFTEMSDGKLKMCNIRAFDASFAPLEWLMDKSYLEWDFDTPVFIIADNKFSWENRDKLSYFNRDYLVVQNKSYCVFAFESDDELSRVIEEGMSR